MDTHLQIINRFIQFHSGDSIKIYSSLTIYLNYDNVI